jgi:hypothetical protein
MRASLIVFAVAAVLAWLWALAVARADEPALNLGPGTRVAAPIQYRQLTIFPVVQTSEAVDRTRYLTLTEGLKQKRVTVSELGGGGEVNRLQVENRSDRPLLILGGELVLGGQQDRILGQDTIVPAGQKLAVQVFCVEHGRWSGARQFTAAQGMADPKIRVRAKYRADQSQVWSEVASKNAALGAAPSTGTYRNLAAGAEGERALAPYRTAVGGALDRLPERAKLVGVVAAVNGRVTGVELFARPDLFAAYRDKLLDSIFMGAADQPVTETTAPKPEAIGSFLDKAKRAAPRKAGESAGSVTTERRGDDVLGSEVAPTASAPPVYRSYQLSQ